MKLSSPERRQQLHHLISLLHKGITRTELASQESWTKRQFDEDLGWLRKAGLPISYSRISDSYSLSLEEDPAPISFTLDEACTALLAMPPESSGAAKILTAMEVNPIHDLAPDYRNNPAVADSRMKLLREAILKRHPVAFAYAKSSTPEDREVEPYKILVSPLSAYLYAWCRQRRQFRLFALDQILHLRMDNKSASFKIRPMKLREQLKYAWYIRTGQRPMTVKILFTGTAAACIKRYRFHSTQELKSTPEGVIFSVQLSDLSEFTCWLMQWTPNFRVLQPPSLAEDIRSRMEAWMSSPPPGQ